MAVTSDGGVFKGSLRNHGPDGERDAGEVHVAADDLLADDLDHLLADGADFVDVLLVAADLAPLLVREGVPVLLLVGEHPGLRWAYLNWLISIRASSSDGQMNPSYSRSHSFSCSSFIYSTGTSSGSNPPFFRSYSATSSGDFEPHFHIQLTIFILHSSTINISKLISTFALQYTKSDPSIILIPQFQKFQPTVPVNSFHPTFSQFGKIVMLQPKILPFEVS